MRLERYNPNVSGPGVMLLSAAIFGYFGFFTTWTYHVGINGRFLVYVPILEYTLKVSAVLFVLAAAITFVHLIAGNLLFGVVSLLSAIAFLLVAVMDILDKQATVMSPVLLIIFAAWNGYNSWAGLQYLLEHHVIKRDSSQPDVVRP